MNAKKVRIKMNDRLYDALQVGDIVIPMWNTFKYGDIIVTESEDRSVKNIHIVRKIINNDGYMYASTCGKKVVYCFNGDIISIVNAPHVRKANNDERKIIFDLLAKEGVEWNDNSMKLNNVKVVKEEESVVTIDDDELLYDSKHYVTFEYSVNLMVYNAYDDKGNKIESKFVKFIKKEYDNDIRRS